jgi:hypothetical protein
MCDITVSDSKSVLPYKSIDAATSVGAGVVLDLNGVSNEFTMQVETTGSPSLTVLLEGSLDGVNFHSMNTFGSTLRATDESYGLVDTTLSSAQPVSKPFVRYVRANVTAFSGGTSPTVTAWVAVGKVY